jgi:glycosyltransferase involved in cell wall biosynthesis
LVIGAERSARMTLDLSPELATHLVHDFSAPRATAAALRRPQAPLRIAYCIDTMQIGGTELNALRTVERIDRSRFDISVLSLQPDGPLAARYRAAGIPIHEYRLSSLYSPTTLRQGLRLVRWLRRERIEILHCHDLYANVFAAPFGRMAGVKTVITSRRWLHPLGGRVLEAANRIAFRVGHWVLVNSPAVGASVIATDHVPRERVLELSNFVGEGAFAPMPDAAKAALGSELSIPADAFVVGCIARLVPVKDHGTLLRAVQLISTKWPRIHLLLVGDGESRPALKQLAIELGIGDRVHFAGFRPNEPNLHQVFDVSVLASISEGFPNSLVEAMAAGRPVVATAVGGNVDAVRRETGFLVPVAAPAEVASALDQLITDDALRQRMGAAARDVAQREYHAASVIPRLEQLYLRLARGAP